jgi:CRISPR-associated endoribonuclease Cas6
LPEAVLAFVDDHVIIARHSLTTQIFQYRTGPQVGFVGMCAFQVRKGGIKDRLRQVNALADLAFYCGTGYKTTMGMGQTRRGD